MRNKQLEEKRLSELKQFKHVKFYPDKVDLWPVSAWKKFIDNIKTYKK